MTKKIKNEANIGIAATAHLEAGSPPENPKTNPAAQAAQGDAYERRPDRAEHLRKIAAAVAPVEYAADDPSRSAGHHRNASGGKAPPHSEVGAGR